MIGARAAVGGRAAATTGVCIQQKESRMHINAAERDGFVFIYEHDAAHDGYHEQPIEQLGTCACHRSDGMVGKLEELVPDGWVVIDFSLDIYPHDGVVPVRAYLAYDPTRIERTSKDRIGPVRRWLMRDGTLEPR